MLAQVFAVIIFIAMFVLIVTEIVERHIVSLVCALLTILAWTLAMGTDIGGSATPIGASANVVGIATAAREGYLIKWGQYCRKMMPATVMVVLIAMLIVYVRYL